MARRKIRKSNKTTYGKTFTTKKGKVGRYKYVNGRRVSFVRTYPPYLRPGGSGGPYKGRAMVKKYKKRVRRK